MCSGPESAEARRTSEVLLDGHGREQSPGNRVATPWATRDEAVDAAKESYQSVIDCSVGMHLTRGHGGSAHEPAAHARGPLAQRQREERQPRP